LGVVEFLLLIIDFSSHWSFGMILLNDSSTLINELISPISGIYALSIVYNESCDVDFLLVLLLQRDMQIFDLLE